MKILVIEPFYADSHKQWLDEWMSHTSHTIKALTLEGRHWKWRMHGAAITLAQQFLEMDYEPDLIIGTDMLDMATFIALTRSKLQGVKTAIYFHENQLSYPWSPDDQDPSLERDRHYSFINYTSCLAVDKVIFSSAYHKESFLSRLPIFLREFPDFQNLETVDHISEKSDVLHLGMNFPPEVSPSESSNSPLNILWNHRWEYDKNPEEFFEVLFQLQDEGYDFRLIILGRSYKRSPEIFEEAKTRLRDKILHWGYAKDREEYLRLLSISDILPVTSIQDFFGISILEAIYHGAYPLLPRRLVYPEHIDDPRYFYEKGELYEKLRALLQNGIPDRSGLNSKIEKYSWRNMILVYDEFFSAVL